MTVPVYPRYQDSGVDWIGPIPAGWQTEPLKVAYSIVGGATPKSEVEDYWDGGVPWVTPGDLSKLTSPFIRETIRTISEDGLASCAASKVPTGSVILSTRAPIGSLGITTEPATTNQGCKALVPRRGANPRFLAYTLSVATKALNDRGKGTTFLELSGDELARFKVPTPSLAEQSSIASFLDRETSKIDALVEAQRRLIELLKEKRQTVISHSVTKGLDPAAALKDSGVGWLGEVPAHWSLTTIGRVCDALSYGFTNPMPTADEGPYMLTANDVGDGRINFETARRTTWEAYQALTAKSRPQSGDILLTKDGTLGRIAIHDGQDACINQSVAFLRTVPSIVSPEFLAPALSNGVYQDRMIFDAGGTTIKHIYISRLAKMALAVPPLQEMAEIAAWCERALANADQLIEAALRGIELLGERRSALISAAVTGKIDVRGLVTEQAEAA